MLKLRQQGLLPLAS